MQHSMEYGEAFTYLQKDPDWIKKFVIASLIQIVPVVGGFFVLGYALEITRRVIASEQQLLPEWDDFGGIIKKGLFGFVVVLVYILPIIILAPCLSLPQILAAMTADQSGGDTAQLLLTIGGVVSACCGCIIALYGIFAGMVIPAAMGKLAATGEIGAALRVGEVVALVRAQPGVFLIILVLTSILSTIAALVGFIVCGIGVLFGSAYVNLVAAHLWGQAYRVASGSGSAAPATA